MSQTNVTAEQVLEANTSTQAHINLVRKLLRIAAVELLRRGEVHDLSKFSETEVEMFAIFTPRLKGMVYDSPEYRECLKEMGAGLQHHYANNSHHPEHYERGVRGMNLFDVVEMFLDWYASSKRSQNGDVRASIEKGQKRFGMSDELTEIFRNTVDHVEKSLENDE